MIASLVGVLREGFLLPIAPIVVTTVVASLVHERLPVARRLDPPIGGFA